MRVAPRLLVAARSVIAMNHERAAAYDLFGIQLLLDVGYDAIVGGGSRGNDRHVAETAENRPIRR